MAKLPARERELIQAHYFEHREFQVLATRWAVSPGRISQLHARALAQLRELMKAEPVLNRRL